MLKGYLKGLLISMVILATIITPFVGAIYGVYLYLELDKMYGAILAIVFSCLAVNNAFFYITHN